MSEDQNTPKDIPTQSNRETLLRKYKNKFWAKEDKKIFHALLYSAFKSVNEPTEYMEQVFSKTEQIIGKHVVFRFLSEGRIGQAIDYMKNVDGLSMQRMSDDFRSEYNIKPTNNISVRGGAMHVNTGFQQETDKPEIVKELAHEYAAWLADSGRLKNEGIPQRFNPNEKTTAKDALTFLMYISAADTIVEAQSRNVEGQLPTGLVDFWDKI